MKIFLLLFFVAISGILPLAHAEKLDLFTYSFVYSENQPLFVYGESLPNEDLIIRLRAPDGTIPEFDQIQTNDDGTFHFVFFTWPETSTRFPFGTYTLEAISNTQNGFFKTIDIQFTSSSDLVQVPIERQVTTSVFAPETAAVERSFRVFVQTTSDGLLVAGEPEKLLATSHVHLPDGTVESLTTSFETLHQGLYFTDYYPHKEGTYVFHVVSFHQGTVSHGSFATLVLSQDLSGISEQIITLNSILHETSDELDKLKSEVGDFGSTLETASENIDESVSAISVSVNNIEGASVQLNALLFPIVASIAIIVALQIVIIARRR